MSAVFSNGDSPSNMQLMMVNCGATMQYNANKLLTQNNELRISRLLSNIKNSEEKICIVYDAMVLRLKKHSNRNVLV